MTARQARSPMQVLRTVRSTIGGQFLFDGGSWMLALVLGAVFRYEFAFRHVRWVPLIVLSLIAIVLQFVVGRLVHLYRGRYRTGSFFEVRALAMTAVSVAILIGVPVLLFGNRFAIPRSTVLVALPVAFVLMGTARYVRRSLLERGLQPSEAAENALVYGAGYLANYMVPQMLTDPISKYRPVGLIDDSPAKANFSVHGVHVLGTRGELAEIADRTGATILIVTIARADAALVRQIKEAADGAGLRMLMLPLLEEVLEGRSSVRDLKDVSIEDLIGRNPVDTKVELIADYLSGKRVLVTGAGGSIGAALCRQIAKYSPAELIMLDRDESGLQSAQIQLSGHGLLDTRDVVLADIRDAGTIQAIFEDRKPEVVFHAAALKHLPMLEQYPEEAWKTNVVGTWNVLQSAMSIGVTTFINISTDKAANPTSILGHSKRSAERITSWAARKTGGKYVSVRFGNVIGSRGSMLPTFASLIESGGPLTVTDPEVTRYFMTIPEACQLVVQAGGIGRAGEVLILDMGQPVRILDIAQQMIAMSGKQIDIVFTGLRAGEKLHEELLGTDELDARPFHSQISHTSVEPIDPNTFTFDAWTASFPGAPLSTTKTS